MILYENNGELRSISPKRLAAVLTNVNPAHISVRAAGGDELTITDIAVDVRPNGVHILLDVPETCMME